MTDPQNLATTYGYDGLNRLNALAFNGQNPGFTFGYDALSRRTSLTRPNGVTTTYAYDAASSLTSVLHKLGTTVKESYSYDLVGTGIKDALRSSRNGWHADASAPPGLCPPVELPPSSQTQA